jgi:hypothetical protein
MDLNYLQIILEIDTAQKETIALRFLTLMDTDPHWQNNTYTKEQLRQVNGGTHVICDFPEFDDAKQFFVALKKPQTDINTPEFAFLKNGKGIHAGFNQAEFDDLRAILTVERQKSLTAILASMGLTESRKFVPV